MPLVESGKQQRASHPSRTWLFLALCLIRPETYGLGLGELSDPTVVGQPLHTKIKILDAPFPLETIRATLIPPDKAQALGFDFLPLPYDVSVEVKDFQREPYLFLTTKEPVFEPYLEFLLQLKWPKGQMYREIVILPSSPTKKSSKYLGEKNHQASLSVMPLLDAGEPLTVPQKHIIQKGDILSVLAVKWGRATHQSSRALTRDVTRWLIENNPHSFVDGDVKSLRVGATLIFPTLEQMGLDNPKDITERKWVAKTDASVETFSYTQPEKGIPYDFVRDFTVASTSSEKKLSERQPVNNRAATTALTLQDAELLAQFEKSVKNAQQQLSQLEQAAEGQINRLEQLEQHAFDPLAIEKQLTTMMKWQQTEAAQMKELFQLLQLMQKSLIERTQAERSDVEALSFAHGVNGKPEVDLNVSATSALTQTPSVMMGDGVAFWLKALAFFVLGMLGGLVGMMLGNKLDRKGWLKTPRWSTTLWAAPWISKKDRKSLLSFSFFRVNQSFSWLKKRLSFKSILRTTSEKASKPAVKARLGFRWQIAQRWQTWCKHWQKRWRERYTLLKVNGVKAFSFQSMVKRTQSKPPKKPSDRNAVTDNQQKGATLKDNGKPLKKEQPFLNPRKRRHFQEPSFKDQPVHSEAHADRTEANQATTPQTDNAQIEPSQAKAPVDYRQGGRRGARGQRGAVKQDPVVREVTTDADLIADVEQKADVVSKKEPINKIEPTLELSVDEQRDPPKETRAVVPIQEETADINELTEEANQSTEKTLELAVDQQTSEQQQKSALNVETVNNMNNDLVVQEDSTVLEKDPEAALQIPQSPIIDDVNDLVQQESLDYSLSEPEDLPDLPLSNTESLQPLDEAFDTAVTTTNDFASSLYPINEAELPAQDEFPDVCTELKEFATRHHIDSDELKDIVEGEGTIEICAVPTSYNKDDAKESFYNKGKARNYDEAMKQISPENDMDLSHLSLEERPGESGK